MIFLPLWHKTDSIKDEKFANDLELGYNNVAGLGLYGLAPAMQRMAAANFSPFSFPNLANSATLASAGGNAQTAEDAMAKLWSPFFNTTATPNANQQTNTTQSTTSSNNSSTSSTNSTTNNTANNANLNNLSNIVTSSAAAAAIAASPFGSAFNPLFPSLAGFQPFDITQAMRLSAQQNNNSNLASSGNQPASGTSTTLDTRSMLNAYINDLNNEQSISTNSTTTSAVTPSTTSITSTLNGLNNTQSNSNQFNFDLFTAERYKAAAACFGHRFFPYNFNKPLFGNQQQQNSQCNSNTNSTTNSSSVNSNGLSAANQTLKNTFVSFNNFNLGNLNNSFGLSSAFPGLNLNNLSSNLLSQNLPLANLITPMNTSLTSSTSSTTGLTTTSPLTPRAPSTPLSASSLSECNANILPNGSNSNLINSTSGSIGSPRLTNSSNGSSTNSINNSNIKRPSSGCSVKDEPADYEDEKSNGKQSPEQLQLKSMERMVECLNQASNQSNGDLTNTANVHLTSAKLNGNTSNTVVPTAT